MWRVMVEERLANDLVPVVTGVRGIGDGVRVGTCTSSDACVDEG
jgi:hypothetical protein